MFRSNILPDYIASKNKPRKTPQRIRRHVVFLLGLSFDTEDRGATFLRNVGGLAPDYTPLHCRIVAQLNSPLNVIY